MPEVSNVKEWLSPDPRDFEKDIMMKIAKDLLRPLFDKVVLGGQMTIEGHHSLGEARLRGLAQ